MAEYINDYEREETQKYEGVYTPEEIELNKKLLEECLKENADFAVIEDLLKKGADPLGATAEYGWGLLEHVYGEIVSPMAYVEGKHCHNIPKITDLFLKYGMNISSPRISYDNDNSSNPMFCFPEDEFGIQALKLLLDIIVI